MRALRLLILFAVYFATARAGLALDAVSGFAALVWAPTGLSLAALLLWGFEVWPAIALAAVAVNLAAGASLPVALAIGAGNTAEALAGAWMLRAARFDPRLQRLSDVASLTLLGAVASTLVSASAGVLALRLGGIAGHEMLGRTWRAWWLGDLMGDLVVAPFLLIWRERAAARRDGRSWLETVAALAWILATVLLVFYNQRRPAIELSVPAYLLFPVLLVISTRFGPHGASAGIVAVSAAALAFTIGGYGPFVESSGLSQGLLRLQMLMGVLSVTSLAMAAAVSERDHAVQAREDFLSEASHELRTPLTALSLHLQVLSRGTEPLPPERARVLHKALRQSQKLARLIDDLLDVSRITAHRLKLEPEEVDLAAVVREVVSSFDDQASAGGFAISVACEDGCRGFWDRARIEQVVANLMSNAVKYGGGKPVEVAVRARPEFVEISVRDHGIGVGKTDLTRIFERFERAVPSRRYGGLGLGLWIARRIVEAHSGRIRVESPEGGGTTFVVELPRGEPRAPG